MSWVDLDIVTLGNFGKALGITPAENAHFTGVTPKRGSHSPNSHHYDNNAIDWRDFRPDMAPEFEGGQPISWQERTKRKGARWSELGVLTEVFGPHNDPAGHNSHVHTALLGKKRVPKAYLEYGFTGRWQKPDGSWSTDNPKGFFGMAPDGPLAATANTGSSVPAPAPVTMKQMDWRADTSSADQNQRDTWGANQGLIQWAKANPQLAQAELARRGFSASDVGAVAQVRSDDPRALGTFRPEDRGALGGTRVGSRRP